MHFMGTHWKHLDEVPLMSILYQGTSDDYPQHMFSSRNKKIYMKKPYVYIFTITLENL